MRSGKHPDEEANLCVANDVLPDWVKASLNDESPDWHWTECGGWIVLRQFDEGHETDRVACKVVTRREFL